MFIDIYFKVPEKKHIFNIYFYTVNEKFEFFNT